MRTKVYLLEGLDCANCAAKLEQKIDALDGVEAASIVFATKQLRVTAEDPDQLLEQILETAHKMEPDLKIYPKERQKSQTVNSCGCGYHHHHEHEEHGESCGCGHHHHHEHEVHEEHGESCGTKVVYLLEGLDCANCAAKIESKVRSLPEVEKASLIFANRQLWVWTKQKEHLLSQIQAAADSIEDGVTVVERTASKAAKLAAGSTGDTVKQAGQTSAQSGFHGIGKEAFAIVWGAVFFFLPILAEKMIPGIPNLVIVLSLTAAYLLLGGKVLLTAVRNIKKGQVFDENFLMAVATLGAFATNQVAEAAGVMLFYRIGECFEQYASNRSRKQIMDAVDMRPEVVNLINGEEIKVIAAEEAAVGDFLLVRPGDRIPLDGIVAEGESRIDTSPVTGESVPIKVIAGDSVLSGCVNTSGVLKIRVEKGLEESMVTRILDSVENAAANKPKMDKFITRFSRVYTPFVVFFALAVAVIPTLINWIGNVQLLGKEPIYWVTTALTFLVISCPCALVLSIPLAFFSGIGAGSKKGILFKGGLSIESLTRVKAVVLDKTGTITEGNFVVQEVVPAFGASWDADQLLLWAASCEYASTHPIGHSIVSAAQHAGLEGKQPAEVEEIAGKGIRALVDSHWILCGNAELLLSFGVSLASYQKKGFGTEVLLAVDGIFAGHLVIADTVKAGAVDAIAKAKKMGLVTVMLTGDAEESAQAVAAQTGIDEVHAKLLPQNKLEQMQQIRKKYGSVFFVGDGINDAPVLAGADVGAAMGSGADAAIEAADVVFMNSNVEAIPEAIAIAKVTGRISWQNVYFAIGVKVLVMLLGLFGYANMWLAVFADTGVSMLCLLNSMRILCRK